jgi:hypothetical protein
METPHGDYVLHRFVLPRPWSVLPHDTTLYNTKLLRTSACAVSLCLAVL